MITLKWQRFSILLLAIGILALGTSVTGQDKDSPREKGTEAKKTDVFGDSLPDGARARMGTLRWRHPANISFVGFTNHNKQVLTACGDGFYRVWDAETGKEVRKFGKPGNNINGGQVMMRPGGNVIVRSTAYGMGGSVVLSNDGKVLAEPNMDGTIRLWDVAGGKEIRTIGAEPKKQEIKKDDKGPAIMRLGISMGISSIAFSQDGKAVATKGFDQVIRLWDTANGKEIRQIGKPPEPNQPGAFPAFIGGASGGNTLAFLGDGKRIVSAGLELENQRPAGVVRIYDVQSGKELRQIKTGQQNFYMAGGLAMLPGSKNFAWAGSDGTVGLYDAESGKEIRKIGEQKQNNFIRTLLISPDGKIMAIQSANSPAIHLWDVASGKELRTLGDRPQGNRPGVFVGGFGMGGMGGSTIAFSADGKSLAEATAGNTVRMWKVDTGKEVVPISSGHHGDVHRLAVSADGKVLTTFAGDQTIRQWDVATGKELRQLKVPANNVGFSGDGKLAAFGNGAKISLWDVTQGKEIRSIDLPGPGQQVIFVGMGLGVAPIFSANGKVLAMRGQDQVLHLYDTTTGKEIRQLVENDKPAPNPNGGFVVMAYPFGPSPMGFSANGGAFAAVSMNAPQGGGFGGGLGGPMAAPASTMRLWNLAQGKQPRVFETQQKSILELAVTPDGRNVVTANADYTISVWESLTGKECMNIKLSRPEEKPGLQPPQPPVAVMRVWGGMMPQASPTNLALSPNGRTLAAAMDRNIYLFDVRTGKELGKFKGHEGTIVSVAFAPDNQTVITGSADTTALVWDGGRFIKKASSLELKAQQVDELWKDLAGDPTKAYQAITTLSAAPKQAVELLKAKVKPAARGDEKRIEKLITDLESNKFQERQAATKELEKLGELAEHALQKSIQSLKHLEAKRRVEKLLSQIANDQVPSADVVRTLRAVQLLDNLGTAEARSELERLAKGAPGDRLTRSAENALKRLTSR